MVVGDINFTDPKGSSLFGEGTFSCHLLSRELMARTLHLASQLLALHPERWLLISSHSENLCGWSSQDPERIPSKRLCDSMGILHKTILWLYTEPAEVTSSQSFKEVDYTFDKQHIKSGLLLRMLPGANQDPSGSFSVVRTVSLQ